MLPTATSFSFAFLFMDIILGIFGLVFVLMFHGSALNHMVMRFELLTKKNLERGKYNWVFTHFYVAFIVIALIHISEIFIWAAFLLLLKLVPNGIDAVLFAGSCYTTVGFVTDLLPLGWKSLAFFIAFSGLFSVAWTTSAMIMMTGVYKQAWLLKYAPKKKSL
ncbi:hypothetical protein C2745_03595 [Polynucleobacter sp. AP-Kolm-20A-A1]|nr:hypothetical protein C2745_03595 [Polynucleobacter sp. AP-Kolm-20A-A1]